MSSHYRPPTGKPFQSPQVRRMEAISQAHHPKHPNSGMHKLDTMLEEKTESPTERKMELDSGQED